MKNQEDKIQELIQNCKTIKEIFLKELQNISFPKNEMYQHLIDVSKKFPEMEELIKFIIFLSDVQNTNNEIIKSILKENISSIIENKIKCLETILEMNKIYQKKLLSQKEEKEVKQELKNAIDELPFWKKIAYNIIVIIPKELLDILKNITNSKIGIILFTIFVIVLLIHFFPKETKEAFFEFHHDSKIIKDVK